MKEIFDWLRKVVDALDGVNDLSIQNGDKCAKGARTAYRNVQEVITEAEAKWKEDCCEWTFMEGVEDCRCACNGFHVDYMIVEKYKFCPYCGKRIKIVEVE